MPQVVELQSPQYPVAQGQDRESQTCRSSGRSMEPQSVSESPLQRTSRVWVLGLQLAGHALQPEMVQAQPHKA